MQTLLRSQSICALDAVNFFVGEAPWPVLDRSWRSLSAGKAGPQKDIGFVLTVGGIAGLLAQYPGGELLDAVRSKRLVFSLGLIVVGLRALRHRVCRRNRPLWRSPDKAPGTAPSAWRCRARSTENICRRSCARKTPVHSRRRAALAPVVAAAGSARTHRRRNWLAAALSG
jgi:hypothetical protein